MRDNMKNKKIEKPSFSKHERLILEKLYKHNRPMSISELAGSNMSWVTTKKYLKKLEKRGYVLLVTEEKLDKEIIKLKRAKYKFNYKITNELVKKLKS